MEIDGIRSPFRFDGVIRQAIYQLKYNNIRILAAPLARQLSDYIIQNTIPGETLVPVPLHHKRLRERGYNQSALIARQISKLLDMPVINDCLIRQRYTPSQATSTSIAQRQSNVSHAFSIRHDGLSDKKVILIDDVATSGATLNACAAALKAAGVASVWGLVLARET
jgi:competence protein ComFC